jgi:hypothetical protein
MLFQSILAQPVPSLRTSLIALSIHRAGQLVAGADVCKWTERSLRPTHYRDRFGIAVRRFSGEESEKHDGSIKS